SFAPGRTSPPSHLLFSAVAQASPANYPAVPAPPSHPQARVSSPPPAALPLRPAASKDPATFLRFQFVFRISAASVPYPIPRRFSWWSGPFAFRHLPPPNELA